MIKNHDERRGFFEGIELAPDTLLQQWTDRLNAGEAGPGAEGLSRYIVHDFVMRVWLNHPQSNVTLEWLAEALEQIFDAGADPQTILRLPKRPANRPNGVAAEKAILVACWIKLALDRGYTEPEAQQLAAERFACVKRHVQRLQVAGEGWVSSMNPDVDWEDYFLALHRPLPPRR